MRVSERLAYEVEHAVAGGVEAGINAEDAHECGSRAEGRESRAGNALVEVLGRICIVAFLVVGISGECFVRRTREIAWESWLKGASMRQAVAVVIDRGEDAPARWDCIVAVLSEWWRR